MTNVLSQHQSDKRIESIEVFGITTCPEQVHDEGGTAIFFECDATKHRLTIKQVERDLPTTAGVAVNLVTFVYM
jgi:hypothetical protein